MRTFIPNGRRLYDQMINNIYTLNYIYADVQ